MKVIAFVFIGIFISIAAAVAFDEAFPRFHECGAIIYPVAFML